MIKYLDAFSAGNQRLSDLQMEEKSINKTNERIANQK